VTYAGITILKFAMLATTLILPPVLGLFVAGHSLERYLGFPPLTRYAAHAPFSWTAFVIVLMLVVTTAGPFLRRGLTTERKRRFTLPLLGKRSFPWWGWLGLALTAISWVLAWSRFGWFTPLQSHTFTPLWLGFIFVVNAATWQRVGRCLLTHRTPLFLALFPASCLFWWYLEYLNQFVQNWHYVGLEHFTPGEYLLFVSLAFSTVLPAVLSTLEWLQTFPRLGLRFTNLWKVPGQGARRLGLLTLLATALIGAGISLSPDYLFPLVWMAPIGAIVGVQWVTGDRTLLRPLGQGDWRPVALPALAALICGFFWELWNASSLAHWEYSLPFVNRFRLFEMPALGYAGYLPFGVECLAAASLLPDGRSFFVRSKKVE
jgi:hypothetical protein